MSSIRGKMHFDCISNQITWNIPYIIYLTARILYALLFMFTVDKTLGILIILISVVVYFLTYFVDESSNHVNQVDHKVRQNMDHIFDENLEMMSTIKQYSREDKHMSNLTDAKNSVMKNLENVVKWRNIGEFIGGLKNTFTFCTVLYILLNNNSEISGPQIVTVFLL